MVPERMKLKGKFILEITRKSGKIETFEANNAVTDAGLNSLLGIMFHADTQITAWYCGLVSNASFTAFAAADVMSSHAGWLEFTAYSESVRQTWGVGASSARSITNGTQMTFSVNSSGVIHGIFITSINTKSGTTGTLFSTAAFGSDITVANGDSVKVTYTVSG